MQPLTPDQQATVAANLRLAYRVVNRLWWRADVRALGLEEAQQAAVVGLMRAVCYHDPARGALSTLAYLLCKQAVLIAAGQWRRTSCATAAAPENRPAPRGPDPDARLDAPVLLRRGGLDHGETAAVVRTIMGGELLREVGADLGCTRERVRQLRESAMARLRARAR